MARFLVALGIALFALWTGIVVGKSVIIPADASEELTGTPYWKQYHNEVYNFKLTFSDAWRGVRVVDKRESVADGEAEARRYYFILATGDIVYPTGFAQPLIVSIYPERVWNDLQSAGAHLPIKLAVHNNRVYAYEVWSEAATDLESKGVDPKVVAGSFHLVY